MTLNSNENPTPDTPAVSYVDLTTPTQHSGTEDVVNSETRSSNPVDRISTAASTGNNKDNESNPTAIFPSPRNHIAQRKRTTAWKSTTTAHSNISSQGNDGNGPSNASDESKANLGTTTAAASEPQQAAALGGDVEGATRKVNARSKAPPPPPSLCPVPFYTYFLLFFFTDKELIAEHERSLAFLLPGSSSPDAEDTSAST